MTREDAAALAMDAERVRDALATVKWFVRGMVAGVDTPSQSSIAETVLRIVERTEGTANVVAAELGRTRDAGNGGDSE